MTRHEIYRGVKKECDLVAQSAKNSDWFTNPRCSNLIGLTNLDGSQNSIFSIFYRLSGMIFT